MSEGVASDTVNLSRAGETLQLPGCGKFGAVSPGYSGGWTREAISTGRLAWHEAWRRAFGRWELDYH